ncbi:MAG TPA: OmpA family protein [Deltaproteobacteria bacterium]|nr:OmpA family protein [Deltaproteobacteria bacterium]HQB39043.1 OmpA family protein [Deltaproteobacteria bacterium]
MKSAICLTVIGLISTIISGCMVAESKYLKKAEDADNLSRSLAELNARHTRLVTTNVELEGHCKQLRIEADMLTKDKTDLEKMLRARPDNVLQEMNLLRQKASDLETENRGLRSDVALMKKSKVEVVKDTGKVYEQLIDDLKDEIARGQITVSELKGQLTVRMATAVLFGTESSDIKTDGAAVLQKVAARLKSTKGRQIRIDAHTDNQALLSGTFPSNWELAAARAISICRWLQHTGINPALLSATTFSEYRPVADNATSAGRTRNNRIEIRLMANE